MGIRFEIEINTSFSTVRHLSSTDAFRIRLDKVSDGLP